ncbi:MAG: hypothetical protein ACREOU_01685 [Candidatus Eiseniibacteriota bacterium]
MLQRTVLILSLVALLATPTLAVQLPFGKAPVGYQSGPYGNAGETTALMHEVQLNAPSNSTWIRVHFDQFELGLRDYVRFEAGDGTNYRIEGRQVTPALGYFSLFLNGGSVTIQLWARAGSSGEGISVDFIHYGLAPASGGISWACAFDQEDGVDARAGRVIAMQINPVSSDTTYVTCSSVALFPGDCILVDGSCLTCIHNVSGDQIPCTGQPGVVDLTKPSDLIVEYNVPASLASPHEGAIQHPTPRNQYRLRTSPEPCLDEETLDSDYAVFILSPNEVSGYSHASGFTERNLIQPSGGEAVIIEGFPQRPVILNHTQTKDGSAGTLSAVNSTKFEANENESVDAGSEGSMVRGSTGSALYGILNEAACVTVLGKPVLRASGTHFGQPDLDPDDEDGCVATLCNSSHGYVAYPTLVARNRVFFQTTIFQPAGPQPYHASASVELRGAEPVFTWDHRAEIDTEILAFDSKGVGCRGPIVFRQSPTRPSIGLVSQPTGNAPLQIDSFFDVFVEIDVDGATLHNRDPLHLAATGQSIPPFGDLHVGSPTPVPLYNTAGVVVGSLGDASLVIEAPIASATSGLQLFIDTMGSMVAQGTFEWSRDATLWDPASRRWKGPLEILSMDFRGTHPTLGPFIVRESPTLVSAGGALFDEALVDPGVYPADSFFDVFFEIEFPAISRTLFNPLPMRIEGQIHGFPPLGDVLQSLGPVPLLDRQTGQPVGSLLQVVQTPMSELEWNPAPEPGRDAYCAMGRVVADLGAGIVTLAPLPGRFRVERSAAVELPNGLDSVPTEMLALWLHSNASPVGPVDVRLRPEISTLGALTQLGAGPFFPANGFFDVFLEISSPLVGKLRMAQPLRIQPPTPIQSLIDPPTAPFVGSNPVGIVLLDAMDQPRGRLFQVELFRGTAFDASCPSTPVCGPTAVDVEEPEARPARIALLSPRPNPTTGSVRIEFELSTAAPVRLAAFDLAGRRVRSLMEGTLPGPDRHQVLWDGADDQGHRVSAGIYFIQLDVEGKRVAQKVMVLQ